MPRSLLLFLYVGLGLLPLAAAVLLGFPARNPWRELSSALVMIGFAMLFVQFLLSGRFRQISGKVGIDRTMRFHQLAALGLLVFIFVHPLLYSVPPLLVRPADAVASLNRMFLSPRLATGVAAWFLLLLLVGMAIARDRLPFRYEIWRSTHGAVAATIVALGVHHTLSVGTYSENPWLSGFWLLLAAAALATLAHTYVLKPVLQKRNPYRVVANERVGQRMWEIVLEPVRDKAFNFLAGQFVWLKFARSPYTMAEHPFSISSAPAQNPRLAFVIKECGDFTSGIGTVPVGSTAYLDGPHGNFTLDGREPSPLVFIAGGVGFAPVIGILRQLRAMGWVHPVTLVYGNRVESQILYRDEIEQMRQSMGLNVHLVLCDPPENWHGHTGELTREMIGECLQPIDRAACYFVCGPALMLAGVERALKTFGISSSLIVSEHFRLR